MKRAIILLAFALLLTGGLFSQHFVPEWWVTPPPDGQNPYLAHNARGHDAETRRGSRLSCTALFGASCSCSDPPLKRLWSPPRFNLSSRESVTSNGVSIQ